MLVVGFELSALRSCDSEVDTSLAIVLINSLILFSDGLANALLESSLNFPFATGSKGARLLFTVSVVSEILKINYY